MSPFWPLLYLMPVVLACGAPPSGEDSPAAQRRRRAFEFHVRAQEPTGILVPMYVYPADVHKNPA